MSFSVSYPTRHTDTFAATGYVHAGVLLGLTEMAYAAFQEHCGVTKPDHIVAVQRETHATYRAPLDWHEGATIEVRTLEATERGFTQEFSVRATASGRAIASFVHHWAWLDTETGHSVRLSAEEQERMLAG